MGSEKAIVVNKKLRGGEGQIPKYWHLRGWTKRTLGLKNMDKSDICRMRFG